MSKNLKKVENEALCLSREERAFLADRLLSSLDGEALTDIDSTWVAEAEHRYQDYKAGKRQGIEANEVFNEADRILE